MNDFSFQINKTLESNHLQSLKSICDLLVREVSILATANVETSANIHIENTISLADEVERFESNLIRNALLRSDGNQTKAANLLGVKLTTLNAKIKRYGIAAAKNNYGEASLQVVRAN
jgi:transcriptional regulator with PAS, ATPase and Fis domain